MRFLRRLRCVLGFHVIYDLYADREAAAADGCGQYEQRLTCVRCGKEFPR